MRIVTILSVLFSICPSAYSLPVTAQTCAQRLSDLINPLLVATSRKTGHRFIVRIDPSKHKEKIVTYRQENGKLVVEDSLYWRTQEEGTVFDFSNGKSAFVDREDHSVTVRNTGRNTIEALTEAGNLSAEIQAILRSNKEFFGRFLEMRHEEIGKKLILESSIVSTSHNGQQFNILLLGRMGTSRVWTTDSAIIFTVENGRPKVVDYLFDRRFELGNVFVLNDGRVLKINSMDFDISISSP